MNKVEQHEQLAERTEQFALRIIRMFRSLPNSPDAQIIGKQVLRSGMSVGANYDSAGRGRTHAEFVAKLGIVVEEAAETVFWLKLLVKSGIVPQKKLGPLMQEAKELLRIFVASRQTARGHRKKTRSADQPIARSSDAAETRA